jgi:hypothetical protein
MMKYFLLFFLASNALADNVNFHPVTTVKARTIQKGTLALGRAPLGNINSTFLANSLNYGVFSRFEIGTSPMFYISEEHKYNYLLKLNFWKSEWMDWSLIAAENVFRTRIEHSNGQVERPDLKLSATQLALNIHPPDSKIALGTFVTQACGYLDSNNIYVKSLSLECRYELGGDIQYETKDDQWLTLGVANMREAGISPFEDVVTGYGAAYTWFIPEKVFSRPTVGIYYTPSGDIQYLFTTTFYEKP